MNFWHVPTTKDMSTPYIDDSYLYLSTEIILGGKLK